MVKVRLAKCLNNVLNVKALGERDCKTSLNRQQHSLQALVKILVTRISASLFPLLHLTSGQQWAAVIETNVNKM